MLATTRSEFNGILVRNQFGKSRRCAPMYLAYQLAEVSTTLQKSCIQHAADTVHGNPPGELVGTKFKCLQDVGC